MSGDETGTGFRAYDLTAPGSLLVPYAPLRDGQPDPPRYIPPPLPAGFARVRLDDDYYAGPVWSDWAGEDETYPVDIFDIPAGQRERWAKAMAGYAAMQQEVSELRESRWRAAEQVPSGWTRKPGYQVQP